MNVYDKAHELAACLKQSDEYREYQRLRDAAYEDSTNKALLDEYKRLQFQAQVKFASGDRPDEQDMQRMQAIGNLLQFQSGREQLSAGGVPLSEDAGRHIQDTGRRGGHRPGHAALVAPA